MKKYISPSLSYRLWLAWFQITTRIERWIIEHEEFRKRAAKYGRGDNR